MDQIRLALHRWEARLLTSEGIGRHQAVAAAVPAGGVRVLRIVENGQADGFAAKRAGVIAPGGELPPAVGLADLAVGVFELALTLRFAHEVVDADAERALLGIAKGDRDRAGGERDI